MKKKTLIFYIIAISTILFSCSQDELENSTIHNLEYSVKLTEAKLIADKIVLFKKEKPLSAKGVVQSAKAVKNIHEIKNKNGVNAFYIINYFEGGYVLLSADKRTQPILAFSESNNFEVDENLYPQGLKFWMKDAKKQIDKIQKSNIKQTEKEKRIWKNIQIQNLLSSKEPPEICYEHTEVTTVGPLLNSTWWQYGF